MKTRREERETVLVFTQADSSTGGEARLYTFRRAAAIDGPGAAGVLDSETHPGRTQRSHHAVSARPATLDLGRENP